MNGITEVSLQKKKEACGFDLCRSKAAVVMAEHSVAVNNTLPKCLNHKSVQRLYSGLEILSFPKQVNRLFLTNSNKCQKPWLRFLHLLFFMFTVHLLCVLPISMVIPSRGGIYMLLSIATTEYDFMYIYAPHVRGVE